MHATLTGGMHALRARAELQSAAGQPMQTWGGEYLYPTLYLMAAALLRSLAENQPFTDGNKRIAWASAMVFLEINGITVEAPLEPAVHLMLDLANKRVDVSEIAAFLRKHTASTRRADEGLLT